MVRLVCGFSSRDHVTKSVRELHWLSIWSCIMYKLCLMMHNVHTGCSPGYIKKILTPMAGMPNRSRQRSAASTIRPSPQDWRVGFSYASPASWNSVPNELTSISDTTNFKTSQDLFLNSLLTFDSIMHL